MGKKRRRSRSTGTNWFTDNAKYLVLAVVVAVTAGLVVAATQTTPPPAEADSVLNPKPLAGATPSSTPTPEVAPFVRPTDRPLGVVFAGDSLTYGLFASSEAAGYRPQVVAALEAGGPVEWSRGGQTGNQIQTVTESIAFPATTDIAVLELGTNDVWKTPATEVGALYDTLVEKVKATAPDAKIVCVGVWSDVDGRRNYDTPIKASCEAGGGTFLSMAELYDDVNNRGPAGTEKFGGTSDNFHPNDNGYRAIAEAVAAELDVTLP